MLPFWILRKNILIVFIDFLEEFSILAILMSSHETPLNKLFIDVYFAHVFMSLCLDFGPFEGVFLAWKIIVGRRTSFWAFGRGILASREDNFWGMPNFYYYLNTIKCRVALGFPKSRYNILSSMLHVTLLKSKWV